MEPRGSWGSEGSPHVWMVCHGARRLSATVGEERLRPKDHDEVRATHASPLRTPDPHCASYQGTISRVFMLGDEIPLSVIDRSAEVSPDRRNIQNIYQAVAIKIFGGAIAYLNSKCASYP